MRRLILKLGWWLLGLLVAFLLILGQFRSRSVPVLCSLAQAQAKTAAGALVSSAIASQMSEGNLDYGKMICLEKDHSGRITALRTNMQQVNAIKSSILRTVNRQLLSLDASSLGVPLGDILFPELLGGTGPVIPVRILAVRDSGAHFESHFSQAGINQTLHQIHLQVQVQGTILVLGNILSFSSANDVMVAETVIVGEVPNSFS